MFLKKLYLNNFRNYASLSLELLEKGARIIGENGAGKTNLLEAIYLLCIGKSQRGVNKKDIIHVNSKDVYLEGAFSNNENSFSTTISIGFSRDNKVIYKKNDVKVRSISDILFQCNIIAFGTSDVTLIYGDPSERRKFLDIVLSQIDRQYFDKLLMYRKNLLHRNALLRQKSQDHSITIYEENMAVACSYLCQSRKDFINVTTPLFIEYYREISRNKDIASIQYLPSIISDATHNGSWKDEFLNKIHANRQRDIDLGYTSIGPHRDDLEYKLNGKRFRSVGSQGQCRSAAITLRICALNYIEKFIKGRMIIILDDAFSELDKNRKEIICSLIKDKGQLFIALLSENDPLYSDLPTFIIKNNEVMAP